MALEKEKIRLKGLANSLEEYGNGSSTQKTKKRKTRPQETLNTESAEKLQQ